MSVVTSSSELECKWGQRCVVWLMFRTIVSSLSLIHVRWPNRPIRGLRFLLGVSIQWQGQEQLASQACSCYMFSGRFRKFHRVLRSSSFVLGQLNSRESKKISSNKQQECIEDDYKLLESSEFEFEGEFCEWICSFMAFLASRNRAILPCHYFKCYCGCFLMKWRIFRVDSGI